MRTQQNHMKSMTDIKQEVEQLPIPTNKSA